MRHKINKNIKNKHIRNLVGKIAEVASNCLGRLVVEGISVLLLDDGALGIDGQDFELAAESVKHQREENDSAAVVEARGI